MRGSRSVLLLALLAACSSGAKDGAGKAQAALVRVVEVKPERVERIVELTGTLGGEEEVTVAAEVEGRVEKIAADLGDGVREGGPIVLLAAGELRLRAAQAEAEFLEAVAKLGVAENQLDGFQVDQAAGVRRATADLDEARKNLGRGEELARRQLASQGELDTLRTRERVADAAMQGALEAARADRAQALGKRAAYGLARKKLSDATIASPVAGKVARRLVSLGEYVKVGQPVAHVVVLDPLKLRGEAAERYVGLITPGMPVMLRVDALSRSFEGRVSRVGPAVAASSRTFPVEALVPNADGSLKPGVFARAEVRVGEDEEVFALPETSLSSVAGVVKVFVAQEGKASERKVELLRKRGSDALVSGGLRKGDQVITTAIARLFDGADVKIDAAAAAPAASGETTPPQKPTSGG